MPIDRILQFGVVVSLATAAACVALGIWASRADLLDADDIVVHGHPFLAWHEGHDLRCSLYGFEPWPKNVPPSGIVTGPFWRLWPIFEFSLWKPFVTSLLLPLIQFVIWIRRRASRELGFDVIQNDRRAQ